MLDVRSHSSSEGAREVCSGQAVPLSAELGWKGFPRRIVLSGFQTGNSNLGLPMSCADPSDWFPSESKMGDCKRGRLCLSIKGLSPPDLHTHLSFSTMSLEEANNRFSQRPSFKLNLVCDAIPRTDWQILVAKGTKLVMLNLQMAVLPISFGKHTCSAIGAPELAEASSWTGFMSKIALSVTLLAAAAMPRHNTYPCSLSETLFSANSEYSVSREGVSSDMTLPASAAVCIAH